MNSSSQSTVFGQISDLLRSPNDSGVSLKRNNALKMLDLTNPTCSSPKPTFLQIIKNKKKICRVLDQMISKVPNNLSPDCSRDYSKTDALLHSDIIRRPRMPQVNITTREGRIQFLKHNLGINNFKLHHKLL